jgi:hypothetical protein
MGAAARTTIIVTHKASDPREIPRLGEIYRRRGA